MRRERIGLFGCVRSKRSVPAPARDLYTSSLFAGRKRWVEATCSRWFILSAKHGLVAPDQILERSDETLTTKPRNVRRAWSSRVLGQLRDSLGEFGDHDRRKEA